MAADFDRSNLRSTYAAGEQPDGSFVFHSVTTPISDTRGSLGILPGGAEVVPIIFVPGIMGSNLKATAKIVDRQRNPIAEKDDALWRLVGGFRGAWSLWQLGAAKLLAIALLSLTYLTTAHANVLAPIEVGFPSAVVSTSPAGKPIASATSITSATPPPSVPFEKSEAMSWKTEYVGRVQMNFPLDRPRSWSNEFDMAVVKRLYEMTPETFWQGVEVVRKRYENQKHRKGGTRLAYFEKVGDNAAHIFNYDDTSYWAPDLHRYVHLDNQHAYEFKTGALGTKGVEPSPSLFKPFVATYSPIFSRIHPLKEGQAPARDGLVIDGAVVSGETGRNAKAGLRVEIATGTLLSIAYLENNYQVALRSSFEDLALEESLAQKMSVYDDPRAIREFKVLRRQERTLAGIAGQETITRTTVKSGHSYYRFDWGVKGRNDGGIGEPTIAIHLQTPEYPNAPPGQPPYVALPSEPELIKLWEFALATFKWRSGALPNGQTIKAVN